MIFRTFFLLFTASARSRPPGPPAVPGGFKVSFMLSPFPSGMLGWKTFVKQLWWKKFFTFLRKLFLWKGILKLRNLNKWHYFDPLVWHKKTPGYSFRFKLNDGRWFWLWSNEDGRCTALCRHLKRCTFQEDHWGCKTLYDWYHPGFIPVIMENWNTL